MAIEVRCPACDRVLRVADSARGKRGACPRCGTLILITGEKFDEAAKPSKQVTPNRKPTDPFPIFEGHHGHVRSLVWSYGGSLVLSAGDDSTIRLWRVKTGQQELVLAGDKGPVHSAVFSLNGEFILSGGQDGVLRLWKVSSGKCLRTLEGHTGAINSVAFYPRGRFAFSAGDDSTVRVWDLSEGQCVKVLKKHKGAVTCVVSDAAGELFATAGQDKVIRLWKGGKWKLVAKLKGHGGAINSLATNADGGYLISGSDDRTAAVWNLTKRKIGRILKGHLSSVESVALSFDATYAATGGADWTLKFWQTKKGGRRVSIDTDEQAVTAVAFDLQSMRVAMADTSGRMRVYDARSGDLAVTFGGAEDSVPVMCPQCKGRMQLPRELLGCEGACPHCTKPFKAAAWSPRHSEKAFEEASKLANDAEYEHAAAMLDDAIESQSDHYGAYFKAIVVRQQMAADLASASDFRRAVDKLQEALGYFERARPWPAENIAAANQLAYDVAFSAAKLCRFNLSDTRRSQEFCNIAKTFFNTNEVEDMLVRLGQSDADTGGAG